MDKIYEDFSTKLLPKIQEGLTITKDYFIDLFSRYVHFLFIVDVLSAVLFFIIAVALFFLVRYSSKRCKEDAYSDWAFGVIFGSIAMLLAFGFSVNSTINAIKDKYVPEIRVIEKIQQFRSNNDK